jgi:AcrR family transcriptional regulator
MDKRQRLLFAAADLFTSQGIQHTSTAAISRHAGVATGTLFNYFASKDQLIEELYDHSCESMIAATSLDSLDSSDYRTAFDLLWYRGITWGCENPKLFWFLEEITRSAYRARDDTHIRWLSLDPVKDFIAEGVSRGIIRDIPVNLIHTMIMSTISGIVAEVLVNGADRELYIGESRQIVWKALAVDEGV